jgi:NADH pyrophosphatase NudC (nudix superfamily)
MAAAKKTTPQVENNRVLVQGMAKNLVERLYGPEGPPVGTRFTELEDLVVQLGEVFQESLLGQALDRQSSTIDKKEENICPGCGRPLAARDPEPRLVASRAGEAQWQEPHRYCDKCRKSFFPSVQELGH